MSIIQSFVQKISGLSRLLELAATTLLLPSIVLLVSVDVGIRSSGIGALSWSHELLGMLLLAFFLMGLPYCAQRNELIYVDLFTRFFPIAIRTWIRRLSNVLSASIGGLLCYQATITGQDMLAYDDGMVTLPVPLWPFAYMVAALAAVWAIDQLGQMFTLNSDLSSDLSSDLDSNLSSDLDADR
ncbi:MAG: TRAP transporter small permease [Pseudomonadales bacterium]|nr:TRAP transporter small permease [Pseudomonadales bacterium]